MLPFSFRLSHFGRLPRQVGFETSWRSFGDSMISLVADGDYLLTTAAGPHPLCTGMAFLVPPGLRHRVANPGAQTTTMVFCHLHCRIYELHGLFTVLDEPIIFSLEDGQRVARCFRVIERCHQQGAGLTSSARIATQLARLVELAVERCPQLAAAWEAPERERLLPVMRHIQDHLAGQLDREVLAGVLGLSVPHLHTLCLRAFGLAPMALVRRERMNHARVLLQQSSLRIAAIAAACGFDDPYYFSRAFHQAEGCSPRAYRQQTVLSP